MDKKKEAFFLEEFGKLNLPYKPFAVKVCSSSNGATYVLLVEEQSLVVFIISPVYK